MTQVTERADNAPGLPATPSRDMLGLFMNNDFMRNVNQLSEMMASNAVMVPNHLRNKPSDCFAVCLQALQWGMNPFVVAQKTHVVNGTLGYEAQLVNAVIINSGVIAGRPRYQWNGPWERIIGRFNEQKKDGKTFYLQGWSFTDEKDCSVTVSVTMADGREISHTLHLQQVRTRNSPLWVEDPKQQLAYLCLKRMGRLYFPDVMMGVYTQDELGEEIDVTPYDEQPAKSAMENVAERAAKLRSQQRTTSTKGAATNTQASEGAVIDGVAEEVPPQQDEPLEQQDEVLPEVIDDEASEILADILFRMDQSDSVKELNKTGLEINTELKARLSPQQLAMATEVYGRNRNRIAPPQPKP